MEILFLLRRKINGGYLLKKKINNLSFGLIKNAPDAD